MSITSELASELRELKKLADEGLLTSEEFAAKKALLLGISPVAAPQPQAVVGQPVLAQALHDASAVPAQAVAKAKGRAPPTGVTLVLADTGPHVMVTGDTLRAKNQLKELGARWDKRLTAWLLLGKTADWVPKLEAKGITCIVDKTDTDTDPIKRREAELQAEKDAALERGAAAAANAHLTVSRHKRAILVTGDTTRVSDVLRALDGRWIGSLGGWCHPGSKTTEVIAALRNDPTNTVVDNTAKPEAAASTKNSKRKRRGGDADESDEAEEDDDFED